MALFDELEQSFIETCRSANLELSHFNYAKPGSGSGHLNSAKEAIKEATALLKRLEVAARSLDRASTRSKIAAHKKTLKSLQTDMKRLDKEALFGRGGPDGGRGGKRNSRNRMQSQRDRLGPRVRYSTGHTSHS